MKLVSHHPTKTQSKMWVCTYIKYLHRYTKCPWSSLGVRAESTRVNSKSSIVSKSDARCWQGSTPAQLTLREMGLIDAAHTIKDPTVERQITSFSSPLLDCCSTNNLLLDFGRLSGNDGVGKDSPTAQQLTFREDGVGLTKVQHLHCCKLIG